MQDYKKLIDEGQYDQALEIIINLLRENPGDGELVREAAGVFYLAGDFTMAEAYFQTLYEHENNLDNLFNLIVVKYRLEKFREAMRLCTQYIQADPANSAIYDILGDSYFHTEEYLNAIASYRKLLALGENETVLEKLKTAELKLEMQKGGVDQEKARLEKWAENFYNGVSKFSAEKRKTFPVSYFHLFKDQVMEVKLTEILIKYQYPYLYHAKVLDLGCGEGRLLRKLVDWGANPENLFGVDLHLGSLELAKELCSPKITFQLGHADKMEFPDDSFDLIFIMGVLQHVIDKTLRANIASELDRVLKKHGIIVTHNINKNAVKKFNNDILNDSTVAVEKEELMEMFPGWKVDYENLLLTDSKLINSLPNDWANLFNVAINSTYRGHDYGLAVIRR